MRIIFTEHVIPRRHGNIHDLIEQSTCLAMDLAISKIVETSSGQLCGAVA